MNAFFPVFESLQFFTLLRFVIFVERSCNIFEHFHLLKEKRDKMSVGISILHKRILNALLHSARELKAFTGLKFNENTQ